MDYPKIVLNVLFDLISEENYRKSITVDDSPCVVNIVDTAGQVRNSIKCYRIK